MSSQGQSQSDQEQSEETDGNRHVQKCERKLFSTVNLRHDQVVHVRPLHDEHPDRCQGKSRTISLDVLRHDEEEGHEETTDDQQPAPRTPDEVLLTTEEPGSTCPPTA